MSSLAAADSVENDDTEDVIEILVKDAFETLPVAVVVVAAVDDAFQEIDSIHFDQRFASFPYVVLRFSYGVRG